MYENITGIKPLSRIQTRCLIRLYDRKKGTLYSLGIDERMMGILISYGFARRKRRRGSSPIYVGNHPVIYEITELGKRECYLTGKRFPI